jgi:hypothetical protein
MQGDGHISLGPMLNETLKHKAKLVNVLAEQYESGKTSLLVYVAVYVGFLGMLFNGVAQATALACTSLFLPIFLTGIATFLVGVVAWPKVNLVSERFLQYKNSKLEYLEAADACMRYAVFGHSGTDTVRSKLNNGAPMVQDFWAPGLVVVLSSMCGLTIYGMVKILCHS